MYVMSCHVMQLEYEQVDSTKQTNEHTNCPNMAPRAMRKLSFSLMVPRLQIETKQESKGFQFAEIKGRPSSRRSPSWVWPGELVSCFFFFWRHAELVHHPGLKFFVGCWKKISAPLTALSLSLLHSLSFFSHAVCGGRFEFEDGRCERGKNGNCLRFLTFL